MSMHETTDVAAYENKHDSEVEVVAWLRTRPPRLRILAEMLGGRFFEMLAKDIADGRCGFTGEVYAVGKPPLAYRSLLKDEVIQKRLRQQWLFESERAMGSPPGEARQSRIRRRRERLHEQRFEYVRAQRIGEDGSARLRREQMILERECTHPNGRRRRDCQLYAESYMWCPDCGAGE